MHAVYDTIGKGYTGKRQPDTRIESAIRDNLGDAQRVLNIGAGTGSYEPGDRDVVALEPSATMLQQRSPNAAPAVQGCAEHWSADWTH